MSTTCSCGAGHATYGACLRSKNIRVAYCNSAAGADASRQKRWDRELSLYNEARLQGVQPDGTSTALTRAALDASDELGRPYNAETVGSDRLAALGE